MTDLSPELRGLKTALRLLVDSLGGTDAAAMALGHKSSSSVSSAMSFSSDRFLPMEQVLRLEAAAPEPLVSTWGQRRHETKTAPSPRDLCLTDVARCMQAGSDPSVVIVAALADEKIDAHEKRAIAEAFRRGINVFTHLLHMVEEAP